jgi:hypothetical protein
MLFVGVIVIEELLIVRVIVNTAHVILLVPVPVIVCVTAIITVVHAVVIIKNIVYL